MIAMQLSGFHRAFANIHKARFQYSQGLVTFAMQEFNSRNDFFLYSQIVAMQWHGFLRAFANIRDASIQYSQRSPPSFATGCNAINWFSSCIRKYSQRTF